MLAIAVRRHTVHIKSLIIHARNSGDCQSWRHHASQCLHQAGSPLTEDCTQLTYHADKHQVNGMSKLDEHIDGWINNFSHDLMNKFTHVCTNRC